MSRILLVVSAADTITLADGTPHPTGFWAEELTETHRLFSEAGHRVDVATPGGTAPTVDPISLDARGGVDAADGARFAAYLDSVAEQLDRPLVLADVELGDYDAVFLPGGHGPMVDLATDADLGALLVRATEQDVLLGVLCHGSAGLLAATRPDGSFAFAGRRLAAFTDAEEAQGGLGDATPYLLQSTLAGRGAQVEVAEPWSVHVVRDGALVSGQNPQSSLATAQAVLEALPAAG